MHTTGMLTERHATPTYRQTAANPARTYSRMLGLRPVRCSGCSSAVAGPTLKPVDSFATTSHGMYYNMTPVQYLDRRARHHDRDLLRRRSPAAFCLICRTRMSRMIVYASRRRDKLHCRPVKTRTTCRGGAAWTPMPAPPTATIGARQDGTAAALDGSFDVSLRQNSRRAASRSRSRTTTVRCTTRAECSVDGRGGAVRSALYPEPEGAGSVGPRSLTARRHMARARPEGTFQLPAGLASTTPQARASRLSVRAVSLFEDTAPSAWKAGGRRSERVGACRRRTSASDLAGHDNAYRSDGWKDSAYRLSLNNLADYAAVRRLEGRLPGSARRP